jgi:hypothetical protein
VVLYTPAEVTRMLRDEADAADAAVAARTAAARAAGLDPARGVGALAEALRPARLAPGALRAVADRVDALLPGDVPAARALATVLAEEAYAERRPSTTPEQAVRATALARGAHLVGSFLLPRSLTWTASYLAITAEECAILARACAGVWDVRVRDAGARDGRGHPDDHGPATGRATGPVTTSTTREATGPLDPITAAELRTLVARTDAMPIALQQWREAPGGRGLGHPGVVLFTPEEVALLVEGEASLYERSAVLLLQTSGAAGEGAHLRRLAAGLTRAAARLRDLRAGDVAGAIALAGRLRYELRATARRRAHHFWDAPTPELELLVGYVEDYLLPVPIDPQFGASSSPVRGEREVHHRWLAGAVDLREFALREPARREVYTRDVARAGGTSPR